MRMNVAAVDDEKLIDETVASTIESLDLVSILSDTDYKKVQVVGAFLMSGMELDECCILAHMNPQRFAFMMEEFPDVKTYVVFKKVAYKASLMRVLSHQAIHSMNEKIAGWILERKYREEYSTKDNDRPDEGRKLNALEAGIEYIRENGDSTPIVKAQVRDVTKASDSGPVHPLRPALA